MKTSKADFEAATSAVCFIVPHSLPSALTAHFFFFFLGRCDSITLYQITLVAAPLVLSARLTFIRNPRINKATWRPPESKIKAIRHFTEHYPNYNNKRERGSAHAFVNIHSRDGETQSERKNTQLGQTDGAGCLKKGRKKNAAHTRLVINMPHSLMRCYANWGQELIRPAS